MSTFSIEGIWADGDPVYGCHQISYLTRQIGNRLQSLVPKLNIIFFKQIK